MRHIGSILLALVFGAAIYLLVGVGLADLSYATLTERTRTSAFGAGALLIGGVLYAVLMLARLSPIGPVLLGLAYLGVGAWPRVDDASFRRVVPADLFGVLNAGRLPATAVVGLLAVPLLATIVSPRRWRRLAGPPAPPPAEPGDGWGTPVGLDATEPYQTQRLYGGSTYRSGSGGYPSPVSGGGYPSPISGGPLGYLHEPAAAETTAAPPGSPPATTRVAQAQSAWPVHQDPPEAASTGRPP